jgi:hypothetical protein
LAKKRRSARSKGRASFGPESSPYFALVAFAIILVALLILFSDFVFSDRMLYGSDTLQAGYYFRSFYVDYVHEHGAVPQWNPYIFGGLPYVEAFHGDIFYPLSALKFIGELKRMLGWTLILHIYLAGIFMYLTARQFRLSKIAALFSAVTYMFAAYLVSLVAPGHDGKIFVTTLFPLVILFIDRGFQKRPVLNFSLLGLVIGVIILSPHPQMSYFMLWAAALFTLYKLILLWRERHSILSVVKPGALALYAVIVGLLLSAIQFYPGYIYTNEFSPRADSKRGWDWATSWSLHEEEAFSLLIPEFAGTSAQGTQTFYWGKNAFKDNSESVAVSAILLALIGLFFYRRKEAYFFAGLGIFAFLYALGGTTPFFYIFYWLIPKVPALRAPSMIMFIFVFSVALLAGMGIQYVRHGREGESSTSERRFNYLLLGFPALLFLFAILFSIAGRSMISIWCSFFYSEASRTMVGQGYSKFDVALANLPAIQSGAWFSFLASALVAGGIWAYRRGAAGAWILVAIAVIPMLNSMRFDARFISTLDSATYRQRFEPDPLTNFFTEKQDQFRVMNFIAYQSDHLPFFGIQIPAGYHGNQLRWYDNLLGNIAGGENEPRRFSNSSVNNPRFLNLVGARFLITRTDQRLPEGAFGSRPLVKATTLGQTAVYRNDNAFPRAYLVDQYRVIPDRMEVYAPVLEGQEDLLRVVYLEEEPDIEIRPDTASADTAWIIDYEIDSVRVGVKASSNKILILTDSYYDAWHPSVDGKPADLLRSYGALQAVAVPAGTREVVFRYESSRYKTGKLATLLTSIWLLVIIGGSLLWSGWRGKREEVIEE